jgi:hypothetical protein
VTVPGGIGVDGMLAPIHEDLAETVDVAFVHDENMGRGFMCRVWIMRQGYGAPRGTPVGKQFPSGSSCDLRVFIRASALGSITTSSPGFRPLVMSAELLPLPVHNPAKSGVPAGR